MRILILRFSSLGDVVLLSALVEALRQRWPAAELWLVTKPAFAGLYRDDSRLTRVVTLEGSLSQLRAELEPTPFDLVLDAHGSLRSRLLCAQLPPTATRRIRKDAAARWLFAHLRIRSRALRRRQVDRYLELAEDNTVAWRPRIFPSEAAQERARTLLPPGPVLALAPGARHDPKRWPPERLAELGRRFTALRAASTLVIGGPDEGPLCEGVAAEIPQARTLIGEPDLGVLAAVLAGCAVLVCNDSGLMHLAEAVETPVLALFGPTSREFGFFPLDPASQVIEHSLACRPCSRVGDRPCRMPEQWCMSRSSVDLVLSQLEVQWNRLAPRPATST